MIAQPQVEISEKANFRHLVGDITWFGLALAATSRFLSVYAIRLGATPIELGLISSLPSLIVLITASLGAWWGRRYRDPVRSLFWPGLGMRFVFLLPALAPFLPIQWQPIWLILAISIPALPQGIAAVTFFVVMRSAIQPEQMTRLLSHRQLGMNLTVAVGAIVFGFWLKTAPFPLNYQVMFLAAFATASVSVPPVSRRKRPRRQSSSGRSTPGASAVSCASPSSPPSFTWLSPSSSRSCRCIWSSTWARMKATWRSLDWSSWRRERQPR